MLYSYNMKTDAIKNMVVCNLANNVFYIAFDTDKAHEKFVGTNKQQVIDQAALRIKRICHIRS